MNLNEYLNKRGITPESRARIDAHKRAMMREVFSQEGYEFFEDPHDTQPPHNNPTATPQASVIAA